MLPDTGKRCKQRKNLFMQLPELKAVMEFVRQNFQMKYEIIMLLLVTTPMRPQECLALNLLDFRHEAGTINFEHYSFRECNKTNRYHPEEFLLEPISKRVKLYYELNKHRLIDGWLFPYYNKKVNGQPYMTSKVLNTWFNKSVRTPLGKKYPAFFDLYPSLGPQHVQYRISIYSLRRFYETYFFIKQGKTEIASKILREIMGYTSSFDPTKHYVQVIDNQETKDQLVRETYTPLANMLTEHQKTLEEY